MCGFRGYRQSGISITVGSVPTLEIMMEVGAVTQTVEVTGQAPIVDVTTSKVAVAIEQDHGLAAATAAGAYPAAVERRR